MYAVLNKSKNHTMKFKLAISALGMCHVLFASDPINVDSLFKKQIGLRSITNISLLTTGNANSYRLYPDLSLENDFFAWDDTKQISLQQTFLYSILPSFDIIASVGGSFARQEYTNYATLSYDTKHQAKFDALWFGGIYTAPSIANFSPQIIFQTAIMQQEKAMDETKSFYFASQSLKFAMRSYSDPVVYSMYISGNYNHKRTFRQQKVDYGQAFSIGADASIVLSPKFSLEVGLDQTFQTPLRLNNIKSSNLKSMPTMSLGFTYSLNASTALSVSGNAGGSSASPDSIFGLTLWKRF